MIMKEVRESLNYLFRYSYDDPEFTEILKILEGLFRSNFFSIHPVNYMPWLRHLGFLFRAVSSLPAII